MDFHFDRRLRMKTADEIEHKSLYSRAVVEIDENGGQVGLDQIPWGWTLSFLAKEIVVTDRLSFESKDGLGRDLAGQQMRPTSAIRLKLCPGSSREGREWGNEPGYSMFGVDRPLTNIQLDVLPASEDQPEGCTAWGSVSYTSEIDFRSDTTDDILQFYLVVPQATYDRYVWNIAQGMADEIVFVVGHVDGFYSEWSPSITTDFIKILAGSEHVVEGEPEEGPPRLGAVGKAELYITARRAPRQIDENSDAEENEEAPPRQGLRWPRRR